MKNTMNNKDSHASALAAVLRRAASLLLLFLATSAFDPREGTHRLLSESARHGTREFTPPTQGEGQDWILVLNDASRNFQLPSPK